MIISEEDKLRFWHKVKIDSNGCWRISDFDGYGSISVGNTNIMAHRLAWIIFYGDIPDGLVICHDCPGGDNKYCCNPSHMFLGTHTDNARDKVSKSASKTAKKTKRVYAPNKLNPSQVIEIIKSYKNKSGQRKKIADLFGVSKQRITQIWAKKEYYLKKYEYYLTDDVLCIDK